MTRLKSKRGRKSNYLLSINNETHKEARIKCLLRDKFTCRFEGCEKKHGLEMHHISYHVSGNELEGDNLKWCVMLCEQHHQKVHKDLSHKWNPKITLKKTYNMENCTYTPINKKEIIILSGKKKHVNTIIHAIEIQHDNSKIFKGTLAEFLNNSNKKYSLYVFNWKKRWEIYKNLVDFYDAFPDRPIKERFKILVVTKKYINPYNFKFAHVINLEHV